MENGTEVPRNLTTFQRRERMISHNKCDMGSAAAAGYESLVVFRRARRPETHQKIRRRRRELKALQEVSGGGDEIHEKEEVEGKIMALRRIVPGGESLGMEKLFEETAACILELQGQVKAMRLLASFFEGFEKEKTKLGA